MTETDQADQLQDAAQDAAETRRRPRTHLTPQTTRTVEQTW